MRYEIKGEPLPVVIVYLESGESIKCEKGAMAWMTPNMKMETGAAESARLSAECSPASPCSRIHIPLSAVRV